MNRCTYIHSFQHFFKIPLSLTNNWQTPFIDYFLRNFFRTNTTNNQIFLQKEIIFRNKSLLAHLVKIYQYSPDWYILTVTNLNPFHFRKTFLAHPFILDIRNIKVFLVKLICKDKVTIITAAVVN